MNSRLFLAASLPFLFSAVACSEDVNSSDVKTSGVYAQMEVLARGDGNSMVSVDLKVGGKNSNTHLELTGGDTLDVVSENESGALKQSGDIYQIEVKGDDDGRVFTISFLRGDGEGDAPDSHVTLPAGFSVTGLESGEPVSRADSKEVTWEPAVDGGKISWELDGDCLFSTSGTVSDTGSWTMQPEDYNPHSDAEATTCTAMLCLERSNSGTIDSAFGEGGAIVAKQRRCVEFESKP